MTNKKQSYYEILQVPSTVTRSDALSAYRTLSKTSHPDKGGNQDKFAELAEAKEIITNEALRKLYDLGLSGKPISDYEGRDELAAYQKGREHGGFGLLKHTYLLEVNTEELYEKYRNNCEKIFEKVRQDKEIAKKFPKFDSFNFNNFDFGSFRKNAQSLFSSTIEQENAESLAKDSIQARVNVYKSLLSEGYTVQTYDNTNNIERTHIDKDCLFITNQHYDISRENFDLPGNAFYRFAPEASRTVTIKNSNIKAREIDIDSTYFVCKDSIITATDRVLLPLQQHVKLENCKIVAPKGIVYGGHHSINTCSGHPLYSTESMLFNEALELGITPMNARIASYREAAKKKTVTTLKNGHEEIHVDNACSFITTHNAVLVDEAVTAPGNVFIKFKPENEAMLVRNSTISAREFDFDVKEFYCQQSTIHAQDRILLPDQAHVFLDDCQLIGEVLYDAGHYSANACTGVQI